MAARGLAGSGTVVLKKKKIERITAAMPLSLRASTARLQPTANHSESISSRPKPAINQSIKTPTKLQ